MTRPRTKELKRLLRDAASEDGETHVLAMDALGTHAHALTEEVLVLRRVRKASHKYMVVDDDDISAGIALLAALDDYDAWRKAAKRK